MLTPNFKMLFLVVKKSPRKYRMPDIFLQNPLADAGAFG
jgi:hypothetical protein